MRNTIASLFVIAGLLFLATTADAQEPSWSGPVFARGHLREQIESTPISHRSYRPFHFYGNTIRRMHYRGTFLPSTRDIVEGGSVLFRSTPPVGL